MFVVTKVLAVNPAPKLTLQQATQELNDLGSSIVPVTPAPLNRTWDAMLITRLGHQYLINFYRSKGDKHA